MSYTKQVDESNPFADSAIIEADQIDNEDDPTMFTKEKSSSQKDRELRLKEEELARKERELQEKSRMIEQQQQQQQKPQHQEQQHQQEPVDDEYSRSKQSYTSQTAPNWPNCKPIIYLSIKDEIPKEYQQMANQLYYSWILSCIALSLNLCGTLAKLIVGAGGKDFGLAILYFFVVTFLSFLLWFRPVYNALKKDSSFFFLIFFFFNCFHVLFLLYMTIGGMDTGGAGFINTINLFSNKHIGAGVVSSICLLFWGMAFGFSTYLFLRVFRHFRSKGHTLQEARQQAFTSAAKSEVGQKAVSSAITGLANSYMRQNDEV